MVRYFDKDGYKTDEENAFIKLEQEEDTVKAFKKEGENWINQWTGKNIALKDTRIFAGDANKLLQKALERDRKAREND